ncbi:MAG: UDP-N-acetylmuramate--alanine ligase [Candidatus Kapabacteria bacterium]|nr:UDP-N-acetylmuramate--alanine ligase [Candidatus Kapabacteria bacterium]
MRKLYFLGIGGTAMGAVAGACADAGFEVFGSDSAVYPPMSDFLASKRIIYFDGYSEANLVATQPDAVIVGNAMSRGNVELEAALDARMTLVSMPELVRSVFIQKHTSVVIAGTHGKTTTSSIAAWLLANAGLPTGFLIGAITGNFGIGCRAVPDSSNGFFVSEGDEYDTAFFDKRSKFLSYRPDIAVINNIEFDHADIFQSLDDIKKSFRLFSRLVPHNGLIVANGDDENVRSILQNPFTNVEYFGIDSDADWKATSIHYGSSETSVEILYKQQPYMTLRTQLSGKHNVLNALACVAVAHRAGLSSQQIQDGFDTFILPKRRLEEIAVWHSATVVDDFAHHPTAIAVTIGAAKQRYPGKRIIVCFEPRSNTTTRNIFQHELENCFDAADEVVFGLVNRPERYPANERLDTDILKAAIEQKGIPCFVVGQEHAGNPQWGGVVAKHLSALLTPNDVLLLCSNGDFGGLRSIIRNESGQH